MLPLAHPPPVIDCESLNSSWFDDDNTVNCADYINAAYQPSLLTGIFQNTTIKCRQERSYHELEKDTLRKCDPDGFDFIVDYGSGPDKFWDWLRCSGSSPSVLLPPLLSASLSCLCGSPSCLSISTARVCATGSRLFATGTWVCTAVRPTIPSPIRTATESRFAAFGSADRPSDLFAAIGTAVPTAPIRSPVGPRLSAAANGSTVCTATESRAAGSVAICSPIRTSTEPRAANSAIYSTARFGGQSFKPSSSTTNHNDDKSSANTFINTDNSSDSFDPVVEWL